ncbi:hypothetical protein [Litchfieldella xinjiangensis]|uniref:hypothetical protein n=1 Tax=Litchfieldella xinjiangensis TaxID=1166948 RepID=UPI0005B9E272|nr:hypothetical protein [Halomonas xinjiangensis]
MLRLLLLAAGAFWLRKPENRELAERKVKEAWNRVMNVEDERPHDLDPYHANGSQHTEEPPHENTRKP